MTDAERSITRGLIRGESYAEIAERRSVSEHTVANQVSALIEKMQVDSTAGLISILATSGRRGR